MVSRKNLKKKFALISVYDKNNLKYLCINLNKHGFNFISSGSTGENIRNLGFKCIDITKLTKSKEMFSGRVKTLHALIYSSILYIRDNKIHQKEFKSLKMPEINLVIVNLYPFSKFLKKEKDNVIVEMIDIGGPSLLRAAAKNFKYVTPIMDKFDYVKLIKNLVRNNGNTDLNFRKKMAGKVFKKISEYDKIISSWLNENKK